MALRIGHDRITSDVVDICAHRTADGSWHVDGWDRVFDRNQAITAMTIAEERSRPHPDAVLIDSLERELL